MPLQEIVHVHGSCRQQTCLAEFGQDFVQLPALHFGHHHFLFVD